MAAIIPDEKFQKSQLYGSDKYSFGLLSSAVMFMEGTVLIFLGWLPYAWDSAASLANSWQLLSLSRNDLHSEIIISIVFVCILGLHDTIFGLPFSLYQTFVVEDRHGFNKTTLALFFRDKIISLAIGFIIGAPVLSVVIWIIRIGGPHFYFYVWLFLLVISVILMAVYPTLIAPLFNKYTKLEQGEIYEAIETLARRVSFPLTQIYVVDGSKRSAHSNAYFYGFFKVSGRTIFSFNPTD